MHMIQDAEKYVYSKVWPKIEQRRDISWLPREQAMTMHKGSEEAEAEFQKVHSCQVRMCLLTRAGLTSVSLPPTQLAPQLITQVDELKSEVSQQMLKMGDTLEAGLKIAEKIAQGATGVASTELVVSMQSQSRYPSPIAF
jgi:hypothetical protein